MAIFKFRACISWQEGYRMVFNYEEEFQKLFTYNTNSGSIMQFTGIKDLKENEVYELDFIKFKDDTYLVIWDERNARFVLEATIGKKRYDNFREIVSKSEVVGNLAENPDILI